MAAHTRSAPTPKAPAPTKAASPSNLAPQIPGLTPDQSATVWGQVQAAQLPASQKITDAQATSDAAAQQMLNAIGGYYRSLGTGLAGIAPQVQQGYQQAAGLTGLLGAGIGGTVSAPDAALNQQNQQIGNVTGVQLPTVNSSPLSQALSWLHGGLPASGTADVGAAANAAARQLPGLAELQGGQQLGQVASKALAADQKFGLDQSNLAAQIPGLVAKYGAQAVKEALAQTNTQSEIAARQGAEAARQAALTGTFNGQPTLAARNATATQGYHAQTLALAQARINESASARSATITAAAQRISPTLSAGNGHLTTVDGQVVTGTNGQPVPYTPPAKGSTTLSPAQALKQVQAWTTGTQKNIRTPLLNPDGTPKLTTTGTPIVTDTTQTIGTLSYQDQIAALNGAGKMSLAAATRTVNSVVKMGQAGRPYVGKAAVAAASNAASKAVAAGLSSADALAGMVHSGVIPLAAARAAIAKYYAVPKVIASGSAFPTLFPGG